jgi:hypothetical protein
MIGDFNIPNHIVKRKQIINMETFVYYDEYDVLCYFTGTRSEFIAFMSDNPDYSFNLMGSR